MSIVYVIIVKYKQKLINQLMYMYPPEIAYILKSHLHIPRSRSLCWHRSGHCCARSNRSGRHQLLCLLDLLGFRCRHGSSVRLLCLLHDLADEIELLSCQSFVSGACRWRGRTGFRAITVILNAGGTMWRTCVTCNAKDSSLCLADVYIPVDLYFPK